MRPRPYASAPPAPPRQFAALAAALAFCALLLSGVLVSPNGSVAAGQEADAGTATPAGTPTANDLLSRASRRLAETESVRFALSVEGETYLDPGGQIQLLGAEGTLLRPDRVSTSFQAEVVGQVVTLDLISIGADSWTTNLLTGEWEPAPPEFTYRPAILFDNQQGIGPVMDRVSDAQLLDDDELDGRKVARVRATVDEEVIGPLTALTMTGSPVTVDLWIDRETDDLLRARLAEPEDDPTRAIWTLDVSEHGDEVTIEPPV